MDNMHKKIKLEAIKKGQKTKSIIKSNEKLIDPERTARVHAKMPVSELRNFLKSEIIKRKINKLIDPTATIT